MTIAISCGEPSGIGPEVAAKAWAVLRDEVPLLWIGDPAHLPAATPFELVGAPAGAAAVSSRALPVLSLPMPGPLTPGQPNPAHAQGVIDAIAKAVRLARSGAVAGICTAPISKKALADGAGFAYPGHTEFLAALAGDAKVAMMLASDLLRVVPATIHIALEDVPTRFNARTLTDAVLITHAALRRDFGIARPRIAVAGLNPHAGEGGRMGHEEIDWMIPTLEALRSEGLDILGPLPADTMFHPAARARYDAAVCAYHDQALIPIKTLSFDDGVNVTLGLPFVRTSPDHGTAFDIAGKGIANPSSMIAAIRMAARMAAARAGTA